MSTGFASIDAIRKANQAHGHHWFSAESIDYHGSRVETAVIGDFYFVESRYSEAGNPDSARIYAPVTASPAGDVRYLDSDTYPTLEEAIARINDVLAHR